MYDLPTLRMEYPFAPLSQNHLEKSTATGRRYKTKQAKKYKEKIKIRSVKYNKEIQWFKSQFDSEISVLRLHYIWYLSAEKLFLKGKNRRLKKTCGDCFNFEKYTTDCIFEALGLDDYLVNFGSVSRFPSMDEPHFLVILKAQPLHSIAEFKEFL